MNLTSGNIYWTKTERIIKEYPYLNEDINCDLVIIGGGISSAITAYFLAKEGLNVIVIEKNIIGYGSTSASTALIDYQQSIDFSKFEKINGSKAKRMYELSYAAISDIENMNKELNGRLGFERKDSICFSNKWSQRTGMFKEYVSRKKLGFKLQFIQSHRLLNLSTGILTKGGGGDVNPYKFTQEMFKYLTEKYNVKIYENTEVGNINTENNKVECITNNNYKITANKLIFASGYETVKYIKKLPATLYRTFTIVSSPINNIEELGNNFCACDTSEPYHYIRFTKDKRIIFGGEDIPLFKILNNQKYLDLIAKNKYKRLYKAMKNTFINIEGLSIEYEYNGTFADTKDSLPIVDEIELMPNCFCNLGFGGNGIIYLIIGAKLLKEVIKGIYPKDFDMFKINR
jgi:glycine/D-amino acid oxidase-like deaminating enzyme